MMHQPQIETGEVTYEGLWADDAKSVQVFRGIAYAAPPVGALRFQPPVPSPKLKGLFPAQTDPTACWQAHSEDAFVWSLGVFPRSEDCLYLNVWTPAAQRVSDEPLPVMVWFHGGGHNQSWGHHPLFDGSSFTDQNVILVTVNYRLGPWAFLRYPCWRKSQRRDLLATMDCWINWPHCNGSKTILRPLAATLVMSLFLDNQPDLKASVH